MKKQCKREFGGKLLALLLSALLLLGMLPMTGALAEQNGELTIKVSADTYARIPKDPEVKVALYQIGVADQDSKAGWAIDQAFVGYKILEAKTSEDLGNIAKQLAQDIVGKDGYSHTDKALSGGSARFSGLADGVYFGMMTEGPAGLEVTPFIVTVPSRDPETKAMRYSYDVVLKDSCVTSATVKKVWDDNDDQDGVRPGSIEVSLSSGQKVTLNEANGWESTVNNLPIYANGQEIQYTWTEAVVDGYASTSVKDGLITTLTNRHAPEETEATVVKVWDDNDDQDGIRPTSIEVTLSNGQAVTLNEANGWTATVTGLPKYSDGQEIQYTWTEATVNGYTSTQVVDGKVTTLTNRHTPEETEATVRKVWDDDNDKEARRPSYIQVTLSNGQTVTLNELNAWTATVTGLPKYSAGQEIQYTWTEAAVDGYESTQVKDGTVTTLTNVYIPTPTPTVTVEPTPTATEEPTPTPTTTPVVNVPVVEGPTQVPTTEFRGTKVWNDDGNVHKTRPDSINITLYADGSPVNATPAWSNTDSDTWSFSFTNLPAVNTSGATIRYTVREASVANYESSVSGSTITNTLIPRQPREYREIAGVKTFVDNENAGATRPSYITVRLLRDGVEIDSRTVTAATNWTYNFGSHPVDDGYGNIYEYTVREDGVPGYYCRVNGLDLVNTILVPKGPDTPDTQTPTHYTPKGNIPTRKTGTPTPRFEEMTEEEMDEYMDILDYGTPLWGQLLGTGDETPVYPYVFAGVGGAAIIALLVFGRKKKGKKKAN